MKKTKKIGPYTIEELRHMIKWRDLVLRYKSINWKQQEQGKLLHFTLTKRV